jgi:hypothetical protein
MNIVDKISRDSRILIDSAKDTFVSNFLTMMRNKDLELSNDQVEKLISLVTLSLDESFQKTLPFYQTMIKKYL